MNRTISRLAGTFAGIALAASVAMPALAAPAGPNPRADSGLAGQGELGAARCADAWAAVRTDRTLEHVQAVGFCEIDRRLTTIDRLQALVDEADVVTDAHQAALSQILNASESGLTALRQEIAGDTTVASATEDVRRIFSEYRIYALVTRQVVLVRADDRIDAAVDRLGNAADRLSAATARAEENGRDVTEAQAHLDAMKAATADAQSEVAGDAEAILAQTPASWNAGAAKPILDAARASISAARTDIRIALTEARAVLAALH